MNTVRSTSYEQLETENKTLRNEIAYLSEQLSWLKRQVFGQKSEKIVKELKDDTVQLLPGFEDWLDQNAINKKNGKETTVAPHTRKAAKTKGKDTISYPEDLTDCIIPKCL